MPGTSPGIAAVNGGKYVIAFQDALKTNGDSYLWVYSSDGGFANQYLGMDSKHGHRGSHRERLLQLSKRDLLRLLSWSQRSRGG